MSLTAEEINELIRKLREKYVECSDEYNPKWFDLDAFEERLSMAVSNRMNLEGFILAEISNFEKIRESYEKKKNKKSFSTEVDRIIDENNARIAKYPEIKFHPRGVFEISHFYGALSEFALYYFSILTVLVKDSNTREMMIRLEDSLEYLAIPRGDFQSKRIEDHICILNRPNVAEIEIERDKNEFLKESAFLLHQISEFCDMLFEKKERDWENPLRLNKLYFEQRRKKRMADIFKEFSGYGAILEVKKHSENIIEDFRLRAFRLK